MRLLTLPAESRASKGILRAVTIDQARLIRGEPFDLQYAAAIRCAGGCEDLSPCPPAPEIQGNRGKRSRPPGAAAGSRPTPPAGPARRVPWTTIRPRFRRYRSSLPIQVDRPGAATRSACRSTKRLRSQPRPPEVSGDRDQGLAPASPASGLPGRQEPPGSGFPKAVNPRFRRRGQNVRHPTSADLAGRPRHEGRAADYGRQQDQATPPREQVHSMNSSISRVTRAVQPVWWLAPSPCPVSPWKYS